jgi:glutamine synthetase
MDSRDFGNAPISSITVESLAQDWVVALQETLRSLGYDWRFGIEYEFYVVPLGAMRPVLLDESGERALRDWLAPWLTDGASVSVEDGPGQWEFRFPPLAMEEAVRQCEALKNHLCLGEGLVGYRLVMDAKPWRDLPGSSMHVHASIHDAEGSWLERYSEGEQSWIASLLHWLPYWMGLLCPTPGCFERLRYPDMHTPTTLSWGGNNRSTALRIPDRDGGARRLELRVASPMASVSDAIGLFFWAFWDSLHQDRLRRPRIYGRASDPQYALPLLIEMWEETKALG